MGLSSTDTDPEEIPVEGESLLPTGVVDSHDDMGKILHRATYEEGVLQGEYVIFNGEEQEIQKFFYDQGVLNGEALIYADDGQLTQRLHYAKGVLDGIARFFANGVMIAEIPYINGAREGLVRFFAPNGQLLSEATFVVDQENGFRTTYDVNTGRVIRTETLVKGVLEGESLFYYPSGALMKQQLFVHGLIEGIETQYNEVSTVKERNFYAKGILKGSLPEQEV